MQTKTAENKGPFCKDWLQMHPLKGCTVLYMCVIKDVQSAHTNVHAHTHTFILSFCLRSLERNVSITNLLWPPPAFLGPLLSPFIDLYLYFLF